MKRTEAREHLMQLIFQLQAQKDMSPELIKNFADENIGNDPEKKYFDNLIESYCAHTEEIDALIEDTSRGWKLNRLGRVDLAILRLAVTEIKFPNGIEIPKAAAINEAVELAKKYGDDNSAKFINGVLGNICRNEDEPGDRHQ